MWLFLCTVLILQRYNLVYGEYMVSCYDETKSGAGARTNARTHSICLLKQTYCTHTFNSKHTPSLLDTWQKCRESRNPSVIIVQNAPEGRFLTKKTEWLQEPFRLVLIIIYFSYLRHTLAHPQCLDYQPPFKPPHHLEFCRHYDKFGCCDQTADNSIAMRYWDIMDLIGDEAYAVCGDLVKDIMCQVCMMLY